MSDNLAPVREGDVIAGKYRVDQVLGLGGMGIVVAATHVQLEQRVALKFLLPTALAHADVVQRFAREARAAVKIHSEHVARVLDVGSLESGAPYMVMEYLEGDDLDRVLKQRGALPISEAVDYLLQACEAIAEAHSHGIVHRDLKPSNLFLANRPSGPPTVKVLDFGISKAPLSTSEANLTATTGVVGTPLYMSPEQMASSRSVDVRSDIWSLGIVLYELISNQRPFMAESLPELIAAMLQNKPTPLRSHRGEVPPLLEASVMRCLEKDPAQRFSSVAELAWAIASFGPQRSRQSAERISHVLGNLAIVGEALPPATALEQAPALAAATDASWAQSGGSRITGKRSRAALAAAGVLIAMGALGAAWVGLHRSASAPASAAAFSQIIAAPPETASVTARATPDPAPMAPAVSEARPIPTASTPPAVPAEPPSASMRKMVPRQSPGQAITPPAQAAPVEPTAREPSKGIPMDIK